MVVIFKDTSASSETSSSQSRTDSETMMDPEMAEILEDNARLFLPPPPYYAPPHPVDASSGDAMPLLDSEAYAAKLSGLSFRSVFRMIFITTCLTSLVVSLTLFAVYIILMTCDIGHSEVFSILPTPIPIGRIGEPWKPECALAMSNTRTTFEMPLNGSVIWLRTLSDRNFASGRVTFVQLERSPGHESGVVNDRLRVDIVTKDSRPRRVQGTTICTDVLNSGYALQFIIGGWPIFLPKPTLEFDVTVSFPPAADEDHPLYVEALRTYMPRFAHSFRNVGSGLHFGVLSASTLEAPIRTEGSITVLKQITLITENAQIQARLNLLNEQEELPTHANMQTTAGEIDVKFRLARAATALTKNGGRYEIYSKTSNAPISLDILESPLSTETLIEGRNLNGDISISVDPAFEGRFWLSTWDNDVVVDDGRLFAVDPSGQERERHVAFSGPDINGTKEGHVYWGDRDSGRSLVAADTRNGAVELHLHDSGDMDDRLRAAQPDQQSLLSV